MAETETPTQDALALALILSEPTLELFCDSVGQPRVRLPPIRDHPAEEPWTLRSGRVRAWIAALVWERTNNLLLDREIDRILNILEGLAWRDQRKDLALCEAMEQDSVLEALLLFMQRSPVFEGTMTKLQRELAKVARHHGLDIRAKNWPKGSPQLSKRIGSLERFLATAGITVERRRDSYERTIKLKMTVPDAPAAAPSQGPSVDKSHHPKTQRRSDAGDSENPAELFARLSQSQERQDP